ncbi:MAG: sugar-binding protein [Lacipirellulaceae bacterium]
MAISSEKALLTLLCILGGAFLVHQAQAEEQKLHDQVRAVVPRAEGSIVIDGNLEEYSNAFAAPLEYFHPDSKNRPGQFFFLWDEAAFYVGLRTLDEHCYSQEHPLWEGDAVEWYFDTRRGSDFLNREWGQGSVHCFFTPMYLEKVSPRFCLRPGYEDAIKEIGIEVAAKKTKTGLEVEFKLPWENFPKFQAKVGEVIGIDAELSYSDGGPRSDRSFLFGSPLSVQQPANLARVKLVERFERSHWKVSGPIIMPIRVDTPWSQETLPHVKAMVAMPPNRATAVEKVVFQIVDLQGQVISEHPATDEERFDSHGIFVRRVAQWPTSEAPPGRHLVRAIAYDRQGKELTRVSPRMVSVNMKQGY